MQSAHLLVESQITATPRVQQIRGLFDLPAQSTSRVEWNVHLPLDEKPWHIGLITGPSGCGKSTIARHFWADEMRREFDWPIDRCLLDGFPASLGIKDIAGLLSSVGFSSPPAWLRPFHVLSTGQQFRVTLARLLAEYPQLAVMDEYTSVVDRTVAQIGSAALAKTVRARKQQFVAITCHEDVIDWLQPDWTYNPATNVFEWRCLQRRPAVSLLVRRVPQTLWPLFAPHHYLTGDLSRSAICFAAFLEKEDRPVAFSAWIGHFTKYGGKREHRTVTLPDFQGIGIGQALSNFCASLWKGLGYRACSTTTHPAFIAARLRSPDWRLVRAPSLAVGRSFPSRSGIKHATTRLTAGFRYIGPALERTTAKLLVTN
ncbi:MAG TPA: ABC transporter ATP-binding protein [Gemmataceae bacterium]|nr:ABC transporter ATP-binding protein [Gemmataceae bacterium]